MNQKYRQITGSNLSNLSICLCFLHFHNFWNLLQMNSLSNALSLFLSPHKSTNKNNSYKKIKLLNFFVKKPTRSWKVIWITTKVATGTTAVHKHVSVLDVPTWASSASSISATFNFTMPRINQYRKVLKSCCRRAWTHMRCAEMKAINETQFSSKHLWRLVETLMPVTRATYTSVNVSFLLNNNYGSLALLLIYILKRFIMIVIMNSNLSWNFFLPPPYPWICPELSGTYHLGPPRTVPSEAAIRVECVQSTSTSTVFLDYESCRSISRTRPKLYN